MTSWSACACLLVVQTNKTEATSWNQHEEHGSWNCWLSATTNRWRSSMRVFQKSSLRETRLKFIRQAGSNSDLGTEWLVDLLASVCWKMKKFGENLLEVVSWRDSIKTEATDREPFGFLIERTCSSTFICSWIGENVRCESFGHCLLFICLLNSETHQFRTY